MADSADVERALVAVCEGVLFPSGDYVLNTPATSAVLAAPPTTPTGTPVAVTCRLYRGWPGTDVLNADLRNGVANVSVYPTSGAGRNTTRYLDKWWGGATVTPTLTTSVVIGATTATVTLGGMPEATQTVMVTVGVGNNPTAYAYAVKATDTLATIAAALATLIPGASSSGAVVTVSSNAVLASVSQLTSATWPIRQIAQLYDVMMWAPSPQARDAVAGTIDLALAQTFRLALPDKTPTIMKYSGTLISDLPARQGEWNRRLRMSVEYSTAQTLDLPVMAAGSITMVANGATVETATPVVT